MTQAEAGRACYLEVVFRLLEHAWPCCRDLKSKRDCTRPLIDCGVSDMTMDMLKTPCRDVDLVSLPRMQHEVGVRNLEILNNSTDAKGRKLEVFKVHVPPPLFRTYKEAEGVHVSLRT